MGYWMSVGSFRMFRPAKIALISVVFMLCINLLAGPAYADSSARAVVLLEVKGEVAVRKAGGFRSFPAYADMRLGQGDRIVTGAGASVVFRTEDRGDEVTLGENADLSVSALAKQGEQVITLFHMQAGSAFAQVTPRKSESDRFEISTLGGVMSAKGTNFALYTNPFTGRTTMVVASGIVRASTVSAAEEEEARKSLQENKTVLVYPAQQINLDSRTQVSDLRTRVDNANIGEIVKQTPPKVIESIVKSAAEIRSENEEMKRKLQESLGQSIPDANLKINDQAELDKVGKNFDNFLGNIAKEAIDAKKIEQKIIDEANKKIDDPMKKIDLTKVEQIDRTVGLDPEVERAKQAATETQSRFAEEQRQLLENQRRLAALLEKIEADKKANDEANKRAAQEAADRAAEQLKARLDEAARKAFEESQKKNAASAGSSQTAGGTGSPAPSAPSTSTPVTPPLSKPEIRLAPAAVDGNTVFVRIYLKDFTGSKSIYAVQVHLLYDTGKLAYEGNGAVPRSGETVFGSKAGSVEILKQAAGASKTELVYAASNAISGDNFAVSGEKLLVEVPLSLKIADAGGLSVSMIYFKIVDKDGNTILDGSGLLADPASVPVPTE